MYYLSYCLREFYPVPSIFNVLGNNLIDPIEKEQKSESSHKIYKSGSGPVYRGDPILRGENMIDNTVIELSVEYHVNYTIFMW